MEIFEQLDPFVRFGQIIGLFPYQTKNDPLNKKFQKFIFSLRHPSFVWFLFIFVIKFLPLVSIIRMNNHIINRNMSNIPFTVTSLFALYYITHYTMVIFSCTTILRYHKLSSATNSLRADLVSNMETLQSNSDKNTIKQRTFIGIFLILLAVGYF